MPRYGKFKANYLNRRALTIKDMEEIEQIQFEISEGDEEMDE